MKIQLTQQEIDEYFLEQWKARRAVGDWSYAAMRFFRWCESQNWDLYKPWKDIADSFIARAVAEKRAGTEIMCNSARNKLHRVTVCMLCWRAMPSPAEGSGIESDWEGEGVPECNCAVIAMRVKNAHRILADTARRGGRFYTLVFDEKPNAERVTTEINKLRHTITSKYNDQLEKIQRPWLDVYVQALQSKPVDYTIADIKALWRKIFPSVAMHLDVTPGTAIAPQTALHNPAS